MIFIPFVLCTFFSIGISLVMLKINRGAGQSFDDEIFYEAKRELLNINNAMAEDSAVPDSDDLKSRIENLRTRFRKYAVFFALYDNGEWIIPPPGNIDPPFDMLLSLTGNHTLSFDTTLVYMQIIGASKAMIINYDFHVTDDAYIRHGIAWGIALAWCMIMLILTTNFVLTRKLIKNISAPLNVLSFGVKQIRENNLRFRLEYHADDEFLPVCDAFNEMAARLETLAEEQKKYEENRRELIAGISHDLRTPLTSIKAYLEGLEKGVASTPEMREKYFLTIKNKTNDLEHIISQLFLFSKLDINDFPLNLKTVDIGIFISGMVSDLSGEYAKQGLAVEISETVKNLYANIDPALFRNVMVNILENSTAYKGAKQGRIEIKTSKAGSMAEIRLSDDGPGVPHEALDKIFDIFYRTDQSRNTKGNGLGLAISQKIVNRMGGLMKAELPGSGLSIVIYLPLANEAAL
jgi:signal transduction histidine kinase